MQQYRFSLQPYNGKESRFRCPACGVPNSFVRYINTHSGAYLADHAGRCNREIKCGYHITPKDYLKTYSGTIYHKINPKKIRLKDSQNQRSYIDKSFLDKSLMSASQNNFLQYLEDLFGKRATNTLKRKFLIGTSSHWPGATVFWQVDVSGKIRTGKIMLYNQESGKRVKKPYNCITWIHSILKAKGVLGIFHLEQCLFGEHQLKTEPKVKPIAIVESEKTAIIASLYMPRYIWLATGGLSNLREKNLRLMKNRRVVLFPDVGCLSKWHSTLKEDNTTDNQFIISNLLEQKVDEHFSKGCDLADFLVKRDLSAGWALTDEDYPLFWDL